MSHHMLDHQHDPGHEGLDPDEATMSTNALATPGVDLAPTHVQHDGGLAGLLHLHQHVEQPSYELPHEPAHRRWQPLQYTSISQSAAGYTLIGSPTGGIHYVKLIAVVLTLDAAGTIQFVGGNGLSTDPALTGTLNIATNGGFVLPPAPLENPWLALSPNLTLGLVSAVGKAQGFVAWAQSPGLR